MAMMPSRAEASCDEGIAVGIHSCTAHIAPKKQVFAVDFDLFPWRGESAAWGLGFKGFRKKIRLAEKADPDHSTSEGRRGRGVTLPLIVRRLDLPIEQSQPQSVTRRQRNEHLFEAKPRKVGQPSTKRHSL